MSVYKQYLKESTKEYHYRIKTLVPLEEEQMNAIETVLRKYDLKDSSKARRTPLQEHPLEFYNQKNKEVYIVDTVLGMPASTYVLQQELKEVLKTTEEAIVVRADNEPIEVYTQQLLDADEKEKFVKLSTSGEYNTDEKITEEPDFGDSYNEKFLSRIARTRIKIESEIADEGAKFNDGIDGVKPFYGTPSKKDTGKVAPLGNYDDEADIKNGIR